MLIAVAEILVAGTRWNRLQKREVWISVSGTPTSGVEAQPGETTPVADAFAPVPTVPPKGRLTVAAELWNVREFDPRAVKALTVLGLRCPYWDTSFSSSTTRSTSSGRISGTSSSFVTVRNGPLWNQHTDNRILFPNLIVVALAHTVHYNIDIEEYLKAVMQFGATVLFISRTSVGHQTHRCSSTAPLPF